MQNSTTPAACVAEVQGLFGPVSIPEQVIQRLWMRGDFRRDALTTLDGSTIEVVSAGKLNRLDGPDFAGAEFIIGGRRVRGDVEIHFYAEDWFAHSHDTNPAYGNVVLHVILFPCIGIDPPAKNSRNEKMDTLVLLPYLKCDIEEYASEEALAALEGRGDGSEGIKERILAIQADERFKTLRDLAFGRWEQKVRFMKKRLSDIGSWEATCHQLIMETLGLRRNREPMSRLALRFSPSAMLLLDAGKLFDAEAGAWNLAGIRPANLPKSRISQYLKLLQKKPTWARELKTRLASLPAANAVGAGLGTKAFRSAVKMTELHDELADEIFAGTIGGTRFETLLVDAFLPLVSAASGVDLSAWWFHWFLGDAPADVTKILRETGIASRGQPYCNGLFQGLIQFSLINA